MKKSVCILLAFAFSWWYNKFKKVFGQHFYKTTELKEF